ncbi:MAG TPA: G1 family glutamic endopeptidase [Candidatus Saccharimonadales bacterium]
MYLLTGSHADDPGGWSDDWDSLGGQTLSGAAAASLVGNNLNVAIRGMSNDINFKTWDGSKWSNWATLGGQTYYRPAMVSLGPSNLNIFVTGTDHQVYQKWYNNGTWSGWIPLGGQTNAGPSAVSWGAGNLNIYVQGTDNQVYSKYLINGGTAWSGWVPMGGATTDSPAAASMGVGNENVFIRGTDNYIYQDGLTPSGWTGWVRVGNGFQTLYGPAASSWGPGRLDLFATGLDNRVYDIPFNGGVGWANRIAIGGTTAGPPAAVSWGPGRIDVFTRGTDSAVWHTYYSTTVSNGPFLGIGASLYRSKSLVSPSHLYQAVFQSDGNLVVRRNSDAAAIWASGTNGSGATELVFQGDGNLVIRAAGGAAAWASGTNTYGGTTLNMQDDGNLVMYTATGRAVWSTFTGKLPPPPTATLTAPATLPVGVAPQLSIASTVASSCTLNGSAVTTNGTVTEPAISDDISYTLQCKGPGGSATSSKTIVSTPRLVSTYLPATDPLNGVNVSNSTGSIASANTSLTQPGENSPDWAGYAIAGQSGTYTRAEGIITIPHVTCPAGIRESHTSIWVGLDGADGTNTVEQGGVMISCWGHHPPLYQLWTEMVPDSGATSYSTAVQPGDQLLMRVSYSTATSNFTIYLQDLTRGNLIGSPVTRTAKCSSGADCQRKTAEWIVERPTYTINGKKTMLPFNNFSSVTFSGAVASSQSNYTSYAFTDWKNFPINIPSESGNYVTYLPIPLYEQTKLFTVSVRTLE